MTKSAQAYRDVLGSDVLNDGMYIELRNSKEQVVACVFRSDATGIFEVHLGPSQAPSSIVDTFVQRAKRALDDRAAT